MKTNKRSTSVNLLRACALALLSSVSAAASACNTDPTVGAVCTFAFDFCPTGYLKADGSQQPINQYQALYSLIGIRYGGDGSTYFNLPDLRGRSVIGTGVSDYGSSTAIAQKGGAVSATLTVNNLPAHTHPAAATVAAGSLGGQVSLPVTGGTVSGQSVAGSVTVNALNTATTGAVTNPSASANTIGRIGAGQPAYYAPGASGAIAVPSSHNLTVSGGTISGATAAGQVALPAAATMLSVAVGPNQTGTTPVPTMSPNLGMTVCIAVEGLYPQRP